MQQPRSAMVAPCVVHVVHLLSPAGPGAQEGPSWLPFCSAAAWGHLLLFEKGSPKFHLALGSAAMCWVLDLGQGHKSRNKLHGSTRPCSKLAYMDTSHPESMRQ